MLFRRRRVVADAPPVDPTAVEAYVSALDFKIDQTASTQQLKRGHLWWIKLDSPSAISQACLDAVVSELTHLYRDKMKPGHERFVAHQRDDLLAVLIAKNTHPA